MHLRYLLVLHVPPAQPQVPYTKEDYEKAKEADPEFYRDADSLQYGRAPALPEANVDKMVSELQQRWVRAALVRPSVGLGLAAVWACRYPVSPRQLQSPV